MWRRAFIAATIAWAAALPLAAWIAARPDASPLYALAFGIYAAGSVVCHQLPERSFHLWGAQLPVCARCTGIYFGGAVAAMTTLDSRAKPHARRILLLAALPTAATLIYEWTTAQMPANAIRALAGLPLGAAVAWAVMSAARPEVNYPTVRATAAEETQTSSLVLLCLASWAIPGAGHLWLGRRKGLVFLIALPLMFTLGLAIRGRLFPFDLSEPLVALAALADLGIGLIYFAAGAAGYGAGDVRAVTYEYGNAFLIVAGLLNLLVVIDACDIAMGRK